MSEDVVTSKNMFRKLTGSTNSPTKPSLQDSPIKCLSKLEILNPLLSDPELEPEKEYISPTIKKKGFLDFLLENKAKKFALD